MTEADIEVTAAYYTSRMEDFEHFIQDKYKTLVLQYESFYNDFSKVHFILESFFQVSIPSDKKDELNQLISLNRNKEIARKYDTFAKYDPVSFIHGDHIFGDGSPGFWKIAVPPELHSLMNERFDPLIKRWTPGEFNAN